MMSPILTIAFKELRSFFNSPLAYIFINVFLLINGWLFFQSYFLIGQATMRGFFELIPWMFLFLVPAIAMRSFAEERKLGTIELLLTMPIREYHLVMGKFLACFLFLAITVALSIMAPAVVLWSGDADFGAIVASYLGVLFMGAAYTAIGIFISSQTDNQIIAFILSVVVSFIFLLIGDLIVLQFVPSLLTPVFQYFGLGAHFDSITRGVLDSRDVIFYLTIVALFSVLTVRHLKLRKL